ncbi:hypothetical protein BD311DRAFT_755948 [Dichomitus squalens]|uniref:Uncharacterized protein n=1 Tax=Dichomitus squalens TaxID=114155 RepID=A0A4Q9MRE5_9APHY|nr:hypothetical protein BD311DRAFT_755948 [Dichomitus squalens]
MLVLSCFSNMRNVAVEQTIGWYTTRFTIVYMCILLLRVGYLCSFLSDFVFSRKRF